jgi:diaminohydroxyphosphoribosylaminopyrimidine deaminase/5-amino-6-(5-phosphoribosylamino)uracil reductase
MAGTVDMKYMRRCLELASKAEGLTYPNPMVGSVIVHEGLIIGEGYHLKAGGPHAEVNALNSVSDKDILKSSTLYVNLEPCSHFGKTPPCADLIAANLIPRVVVGTIDTNAKVSGQGISFLRKKGCEVITGILEEECRWLNRRFLTFHEKKRPYIILKWAQSSDGYVDIKRAQTYARPTWISGKPERALVHKWRAAEQAILVGAGTVRADNPMLNVREWKGPEPLKIILSSSGKIDEGIAVNETDEPVIIFTHSEEAVYKKARKVKLVRDIPSSVQICDYLYNSGLQSLFIEGGTEILNHFISEGLWDEARIFTGFIHFHNGIKAPEISGKLLTHSVFSHSLLDTFINTESQ